MDLRFFNVRQVYAMRKNDVQKQEARHMKDGKKKTKKKKWLKKRHAVIVALAKPFLGTFVVIWSYYK